MKKTSSSVYKGRRIRQQGSAIFIILLAIFLLGALYYAFAQSTRANLGLIEGERDDAAQIASTDCQTAITAATKRLQLRGCGTLISSAPDGSNANIGAPTDGSCSIYHVNGGGVKNCQNLVVSTDACDNSPAPGQICADGSVYAGLSPDGNTPMFTTPADGGAFSWNNGTHPDSYVTMTACSGSGGTCNTGKANTDALVALDTISPTAPYAAAEYCDNLVAHGKSDWYLPALNELQVLFSSKNDIGGFDTSGNFWGGTYWSSSELGIWNAIYINMNDGSEGYGRFYSLMVRCVRKD